MKKLSDFFYRFMEFIDLLEVKDGNKRLGFGGGAEQNNSEQK